MRRQLDRLAGRGLKLGEDQGIAGMRERAGGAPQGRVSEQGGGDRQYVEPGEARGGAKQRPPAVAAGAADEQQGAAVGGEHLGEPGRVGIADPALEIGGRAAGFEQRTLEARQRAGQQVEKRIGKAQLPIGTRRLRVSDGDDAARDHLQQKIADGAAFATRNGFTP